MGSHRGPSWPYASQIRLDPKIFYKPWLAQLFSMHLVDTNIPWDVNGLPLRAVEANHPWLSYGAYRLGVGGGLYLGCSNRECTQFQSNRFPVFGGMDLEQWATIRFLELMPRKLPARWSAISDCRWPTDCKFRYVLGCLDGMMRNRMTLETYTGYGCVARGITDR